MRSIRRSMMVYLLVLLFITLAVVGGVIDRVTEDALAAREAAGMALIQAEYEERCKAERDRTDEALLNQAKFLYGAMIESGRRDVENHHARFGAASLMFFTNPLAELSWTATGNVFLQRDRTNGPPPLSYVLSAYSPLSQAYWSNLPPIPISNEYIRVMSARMEDPGETGQPADAHERTGLSAMDFQDYQQIDAIPGNTSATGAREWASESLQGRKLQDPQELDIFFEHGKAAESAVPFFSIFNDYTIPSTREQVRRVIYKVPHLGIRGPGGPGFGGGGQQRRPPAVQQPSTPGATFAVSNLPRLYIQCARPKAAIDKVLEEYIDRRDEKLTTLASDIRHTRTNMRLEMLVVGLLALVGVTIGGPVIIGVGLRPVGKLSVAVSRVSERDFKLPHDGSNLVQELAPIHSRLTQTLDQLRRAFSREKQAVADISHELRTPIAALMATIDVALRKPRTPEQYRSALEECRLISKQLGQLVERIMTLATLDAGNDRTDVGRTDAIELAASCAAVIRPLAANNDVTVHVHLPNELVELDTDSGKLREVLINLLHNAVEYNRVGGTIDLTLRREKCNAVFEVRDTGIGMTPEIQEKIFERFFRADPSRHATGVHAGLGLAIVKEYVNRLHGEIVVESEPGVGSTFRVVLPAVPADQPFSDEPAESVAAKT
jgi:signal transduction histidine kinase